MKEKNTFKVYDRTVVFFLWDKQLSKFFRGVAVCSPEDEFDLETGKSIAKLKALHKMQIYKADLASRLLQDAEMYASLIEDFKNNYSMWMDKAEHTYDRLMKVLEPLTKNNKKPNE